MSERFGRVLVPGEARPGRATVRISIEDASIADASSIRLAAALLPDVDILPDHDVLFAVDVDDPVPSDAIVRVHVDRDGDGELSAGDLLTTQSIPVTVLGDTPATAGGVPVRVI